MENQLRFKGRVHNYAEVLFGTFALSCILLSFHVWKPWNKNSNITTKCLGEQKIAQAIFVAAEESPILHAG